MLQINDIAISPAAWSVLDRLLLPFAAREDAPVLVYWSRFVEPDGTTVAKFQSGYGFFPSRIEDLSPDCGVLQFPGRRSLYLVPRTGWDAAAHYRVDLISERFAVFSIDPMG
jgi:hypothetical protein